ncbi:MAG TPA: hypothetical protein VHE35_02295 [Kofleriaceae bacterium]|nr:hypothetical protein [Kofleriaceae bacterium]
MRLASSLLAPLVAALAAAGCGGGSYTVVTIDARPAVGDVRTLAISLANASATQAESFVVDGRSFPLTFSVDTGDRGGELGITVDADDGTGTLIAHGEATTPIAAGGSATVMLEPTDFLVNTSFVGDQALAFRGDAGGRQIAVSSSGVATIGWSDSCQVVGRCDVFGRRFDAHGRPVATSLAAGTGEFIINRSDTTGYEPSLATSSAGHTLAVWSTGTDLLAVVVDADGAALTASDTEVATGTDPTTPAVIAVPDGRFVVAWTEDAPTAGQYLVRARYLSADGQPTANPVTQADTAYTVSTTAMTEPAPPALAWLGDGLAMAVGWRTGTTLRGRFYTSAGVARTGGDLVLASRPAAEEVGEPQLTAVGGDVALLYPRTTSGGDADQGQLVLRRLSTAGTIVGSDATVTDGCEPTPAALAGDGATLAAAWSTCGADSDGDTCAIRFRRFDANLTPLGDSRIANTITAGSQEEPSLAILPDGSLILAWSDGSATPPDGDGFGVRARIVYP